MRLAVISDIHGNLLALEAVLRDIDRRGVDAIVNLGDCVTSPLWPRETLELLATRDIPTVRGNHDRWLSDAERIESIPIVAYAHSRLTDQQRASLASLPSSLTLDDDVLAVHGTPSSDTEYLLEQAVDGRLALATRETLARRLDGVTASLVLCGHSHHQHVAWARNDQLVLNPGSVGCPRTAGDPGARSGEATSPHARYAVATRRNDRWTVEQIVLDYDWTGVAECAVRNDRPDWAEVFA